MGCGPPSIRPPQAKTSRPPVRLGQTRRRHQHPVSLFGCLTGAAALVESSRPSPTSDSQFFHAGPQGECRRPVALTGLAGPSAKAITPAGPRRKAPTAVFTAHFPPHNRNGWTAGHSDTVSHSHIDPSPGAGGLPSAIPPPRRLAGCSWVLGPPNFCSALGTPPRGCLPDG
jgi:hypothetical protein